MKNLAKKIKELMSAFDSIYYNYRMAAEYGEPDPSKESDDVVRDFQIDMGEKEEHLGYIADSLFPLVKAYIEEKKLSNLYNDLVSDIKNLKGEILKGDEEMGSTLINTYRKYLNAFDDFGNGFYEHREKFEILEHLLNNTAVILNDMKMAHSKEVEIYTPMKHICKAAFPDSANAKYSFQQTAKCYKPDILIPSLSCAIEYKYAVNESELNDLIDQILTDVQGYSGNPTYNVFYAVFYANSAFCSKDRFDVIWKEKDFPNNWKGIYVQG